MIYFLVLIFLLWLSYLYDYRGQKRGFKLSFAITLILFIAIAGLRYRVGGDTSNYMKYFDLVHTWDSLSATDFTKSRFAPGFVFLTSSLKTLINDYLFFQLFHATVINCVVFWFIRKNCKHVFFALFLFFNFLYFYLLFEQVRESFAVAIFLLAWPAFKRNCWWQWYLASICAFMMHISAFIMFFLPIINLPWIRNIFIYGRRTWVICFIVLLISFVIQTTLFRYVQMIAVTESMFDRAQAYGSMNSEETFNINRIVGNFFQFIIYPLLALYFLNAEYKQQHLNAQQKNTFDKENMMVLMSVYISILSIFVGIFVRYNNYFFLFAIITMSDWVFSKLYIARKYVRLGYLYWILIFIPMLSFNIYITYLTPVNKSGTLKPYMMYVPYSSMFDQTKDQDREKTIIYIRRSLR